MTNTSDDNNSNPNAPGFKAPDEFPTMEEVGEESKRKEQEAQTKSDVEIAAEQEKKGMITRRRFLIFAGILGLAAIASNEIDKQRQSEIKAEVDQMLEQIDLSELMNIQSSNESEAVENLRKKLEKDDYEEDSATDNLLSPKLTKLINKVDKDLMDEDLEELPEACGRYKYDKYEMDIDEPFKLRGPAAKAFIEADKAMVAAGKGHIKIARAFSVNMQQNDLFVAKQENPKLPPAAPPGHSLHEAGLAVDVANWSDAKPFLIDAGFHWLGGWRWSEKHHFQWGVSVKESVWMEGIYQINKHVNLKKGKKWLKKGQKKLERGVDWVKKQF